jgi:hypothetical protein
MKFFVHNSIPSTDYPLPNIGQMIAFLTENEKGERKFHYTQEPMRRTEDGKPHQWVWTHQWGQTYYRGLYLELVDALWEAVKSVLGK